MGTYTVDGLLANSTTAWDSSAPSVGASYTSFNGFDLIWSQNALATQMKTTSDAMTQIEGNDNLTDTEKMFDMQMTMNTWSSIANLRTNILKSVSDTLKSIGRNIN